MLFVPAFAIGAHSAAKLVHFSFLIATVSLLRHIARELGIVDTKACCGAALFFLSPVVAVTATSAYTDLALVCCVCTILYLLIRWNRERATTLLVLAGLNAGFCYSIKPTFGWVGIVALGFVVSTGRKGSKRADMGTFLLPAAIGILPWMIRAAMLTGDPVAPFLSVWFPNSATTPAIETGLLHSYSAFRGSFSWKSAILDYTILGGNQGLLGPAFLVLPAALLALRKRSLRWLVSASLLLAIPIVANTGTRFLMPALAPASIALASVLPGPAALALVGFQMIGTASPVIDLYDRKHDWRLPEIPLLAALRIEPEQHYLQRSNPDFANDRMVVDSTSANARIFALASIHQAYLPREVLVYWQSELADRFLDYLAFAHESRETPAGLFSWRWAAGEYGSFRVSSRSDLRIVEEQLDAGLNSKGAMTWMLLKPGDLVDFHAPSGATGADLLVWPADPDTTQIQARSKSGEWQPIDDAVLKSRAALDLRRSVTAYIRRSGYHYIVVSLEKNGAFSAIGKDMLEHSGDWGVEPAASNGSVWLFYLSNRRS
jgi:hypothetical protein